MDTYRATNTINGKFYIGSSVNFEERKKAHLSSKENYPFQNALRKNPEAFIWEVWSDDSEDRELEQALLNMWFGKEQCYNLSPYATFGPIWDSSGHCWVNNGEAERYIKEGSEVEEGWAMGRLPLKDETKEKMRAAQLGKIRPECATAVGRVWVTNVERTEEVYLKPGEETPEGWIKGRTLKGKKRPEHSESMKNRACWVNSAGEVKLLRESPGPGWQNGRVYRPDREV
jgi:group I intron endonuclease